MVAEQVGQLLAVGSVFVDTEFEVLGEGFVELLVVFGILGNFCEHIESLLDQILLDDAQDLVLLEVLSRDVEGEIFRVNDTLDKRQPLGDQVFAVVHDENATDVQLDVVLLLLGFEEIKGRALGDKEDRFEFQLTFNGKVLDGEVFFPVVGDGFVESSVFLLGAVLGFTGPDGFLGVEQFPFLGCDLLLLLFLLVGFLVDFFDLGLVIIVIVFLVFLFVVIDFGFFSDLKVDGEANKF
mmetsp:Transcript_1001/g.1313  ORF Transcript_1001/g.1313 Transcript_1001/m.1313 type:complete len:238 (+) Transcript_1001:1085-1798(+)